MSPFIKIPENLIGKYFFSEDSQDDFGIYKVSSYDDGRKRHVYLSSVNTSEEARDLCEKLNECKMTEQQLFESLYERRDFEKFLREYCDELDELER